MKFKKGDKIKLIKRKHCNFVEQFKKKLKSNEIGVIIATNPEWKGFIVNFIGYGTVYLFPSEVTHIDGQLLFSFMEE